MLVRWSVLLLGLGTVWMHWVADSPLFSVLWLDCDLAESSALAIDRSLTGLFGLAALAVAISARAVPAVLASLLLVLWTGVAMHSTERLWAWMPAARSTRIVAPLVVWWLATRRLRAAEWGLRIGAAGTFLAHGVEALALEPKFQDLVFAASRCLGTEADPDLVDFTLRIIGGADVLLALAILVVGLRGPSLPSLLVAGYMAFWGLVTALSRVVQFEWGGVPAALIRAPNAAVPAALVALWWSRSARESPPHSPE